MRDAHINRVLKYIYHCWKKGFVLRFHKSTERRRDGNQIWTLQLRNICGQICVISHCDYAAPSSSPSLLSWATSYSAYTTTPKFRYLKWVLNVRWDCSWLQWRTFGMTCVTLPAFKLPLSWQNKQFFDSTLNSLCENVLHWKCLAVTYKPDSRLLTSKWNWDVNSYIHFRKITQVKKEEELWKSLNKFYIILCKSLEPTVISLYFVSKHPHFLKHF